MQPSPSRPAWRAASTTHSNRCKENRNKTDASTMRRTRPGRPGPGDSDRDRCPHALRSSTDTGAVGVSVTLPVWPCSLGLTVIDSERLSRQKHDKVNSSASFDFRFFIRDNGHGRIGNWSYVSHIQVWKSHLPWFDTWPMEPQPYG